MLFINRENYITQIRTGLKRSPALALLGPRQCGKTTLAQEIAKEQNAHFFDLESPKDQLRLENPELSLSELSGLVIIDEIQLKPALFPVIRTLIDNRNINAKYLLLGSAAPTLLRSAGESLAGRIEFVDLHGFDLQETGHDTRKQLWSRGGFPLSYLAESDENSYTWREAFIRTFLQRDLPQLGINIAEPTMRRFWTMLSHNHGETLNSSSLARSMGVSDKTINTYVDHLAQTYMLRVLPPWFENLKKRQVKSPKIYIRDSGLLHTLLSIPTLHSLQSHSILGASWEGFAIEQIIRCHNIKEPYFWATQSGAELDLLIIRNGKRYGFEIKTSENPSTTRSMSIALNDLKLQKLFIVYPGEEQVAIRDNIEIIGLNKITGIF